MEARPQQQHNWFHDGLILFLTIYYLASNKNQTDKETCKNMSVDFKMTGVT